VMLWDVAYILASSAALLWFCRRSIRGRLMG